MKGFTSLLFPLAILLVVAAPNPTAGQVVASPPATPCQNLKFNTSLVPFDTSDLLCTTVWSEQDFMLMYKYNADTTTWSFVLSAPNNNSYIGIGFSNDGQMGGSSAVVGWRNNGTSKAKQYYLGGYQATDCQPDKGNLTLGKGTPVMLSQLSHFYLAFQLNATKDGLTNKLIYAVGPSGFVPKSDNLLEHHSSKTSTTIAYFTESTAPGSSPTTGTASGPNGSPPRSRAHGLALGRLSMATLAIVTLLAMSLL